MDEQDDLEQRRRNPKGDKGSFMTKLYRDDDEYNELKVQGLIDEDDAEVLEARADGQIKRKTKELDKKQTKTAYSSTIDKAASRIPKLALRKGALAMFAVCEVGDDHLIVNHTRNSKGYVSLVGLKLKSSQFQVGQLLIASINAEIGGANTGEIYSFATGKAGLNKKIQLSLDCVQINKQLSASTVSKSMVFQAIIESKEAKGFILNLGFRDNTKGFLKFSAEEQALKKGDLITVSVKSVDQVSKVLKCELISESNRQECVHQSETVTATQMKPGFMVSGKVSKMYENGVEISFLGGITATCFIDHLAEDITEYKVGKKCNARIIGVDSVAKKITVSMLDSILNWTKHKPEFKIGQTFDKVKISKSVYGRSYIVNLPNGQGFLHKSQTAEAKKAVEAEDSDEPIKQDNEDFEVGLVLEQVKVKEINYFDSKPILSMRQSLLKTDTLSFDTVKVGQFFQAVIEKIVPEKNYIQLSINNFVKGNLHIEHMADNAIKQMPPKFLEVGKDIRVRVLSVNPSKRSLEFTKKDSLMKEDAPVYQSYKEVKNGDKLVGVIVALNAHGYVITSFGSIKGLLNFEDVEEKLGKGYDKTSYKVGSIVKAYVLFKKKDKGVALTLSKKKAKADREDNQQDMTQTLENQYLPNDEELEKILSNEKYSTMLKSTKDPALVGQLNHFRILEEQDKFYVLKSLDASKKSKNFIGLLPKCFSSSENLSNPDFTCSGLILDQFRGQIPIISIQPDLISLKDEMVLNHEELPSGSTYIGVVNGIVGKSGAVSVRFMGGKQKIIKVKDLNVTQEYKKVYAIGKVVRVAVNKLGRLCTKAKVIEACVESTEADKVLQINSFCKQFSSNLKEMGVKLGQEIESSVQLVKDYGIIVQIEGENVQTGFIINDHKGAQSKYKQGQALKCVVLDVDPLKKIADLSEKTFKKSDKEIQIGSSQKAIVELNKDSYLIISLKNNRRKFGICILQNLNHDNEVEQVSIGDEIDVNVHSCTDGLYQLIPTPKVAEKKKSSNHGFELKEGIQFMGLIKSIKNSCMYIQVPQAKGIGRLHMVECPKFEQYTVGDKIEAKILKVTQEKDRTWIELTRNATHMSKVQGLDPETLKDTPMQDSDLKSGKMYDAVIISSTWDSQDALNLKLSEPIHIQLSPFVRGKVPFNQILGVDELAKFGSQVFNERKFKVGQQVKATYIGNGQFSMIDKVVDQKVFKRGEILTCRYVKLIKGRGVTVQVNQSTFGFIEVSEITDDISGNVFKFLQKKSVFAARVIDHDKNGKIQLCTRESVIDQENWNNIKPEGTTVKFQNTDKVNQERGNQRNKILKFGAAIALVQGDLAVGYIVNIGKAGCFVQIGHNTVIRAGLNELSDSSNFNFTEEMPIGRIVMGRVYRIDTQAGGEKRFHFSTRQSIVVYGALAVARKSLTVGQEVESIVMALADGKAFAQIKGSYVQIKVKGHSASDSLKQGDHIFSTLKKVTKDKVSSVFIGRDSSTGEKVEMSAEERQAQSIYLSVKEEAEKDIESIKEMNNQKVTEDFDATLIDQRNFLDKEAQMAQQIQDLNELDQEDDDENEIDSKDSDAEDMKRIIDYDDDDEEMEAEEEGEQESDEEMQGSDPEDDSSEEEEVDPKKSKKRTLKDRLKEEQTIRDKEQKMRSGVDKPQDIDDFERLLIAQQDQSYLWIQYMAFMLDNVGIDAARKVVERGVKAVGISNDEDKLNIWTAFMNLESNFGTQESLEACTRRALEVNDRKKVYLNLIDIYKSSMKYGFAEVIYKQLSKKYGNSLEIWTAYIEFLIEMKAKKEDETQKFVLEGIEFSEAKTVLQRALQALTKDQHVPMISKFGMLEFKYGSPENGRTMFEGIVSNYPKRMDIWSIYMDMEMKYGQGNVTQARHLFERCLNSDYIQKKPKKMKLVFQKYMEYENKQGNKNNLAKLRERVEQYLSKHYDEKKSEGEEESEEN